MKTAICLTRQNENTIIEWYYEPLKDSDGQFTLKAGTSIEEGIFKHRGEPKEITFYRDNEKFVISYQDWKEIDRELMNIKSYYGFFGL